MSMRNDKLCIVHLITGLGIGGAERALYNLLQATKDSYNHVVISFRGGVFAEKIANLGIPCYRVTGLVHTYDPVLFVRLVRLLRLHKPALLHTSLWSANILGRLLGRWLGIPVVSALHGNCQAEGRLRNWFERLTSHMPQRLVAVCQDIKQSYLQHIAGNQIKPALRERITVVRNGIDVQAIRQKAYFQPLDRVQFGFADTDFVVGAVGRVEPVKAYHLLLQAIALCHARGAAPASMPSIKLCLVGDGSQLVALKRLAAKLHIQDHVVFVGSRTDAYRFYPIFDCFALSSHSEGLSIALLEALAFGLPLVSTHHSMQHEVIVHSTNGLLVKHDSAPALAHAIQTLARDRELCERMRIANYQLATQQFDMKRVAQEYDSIFAQVAGVDTQEQQHD